MGRWLVVAGLVCGALAGCLGGRPERTTARLHAPPPAALVGDDVVYLDVWLIERPLGDAFLTRGLWAQADETTVRADGDAAASLERRAALEKNGLRAGQLGGLLAPTELQDLMVSPRACQANRIQLHAGHDKALPLGPPRARCRCRLVRDDHAAALDLPNAQGLLEVVPELAEEGRIRVRFTPRVRHGEVRAGFVPIREADGLLHWGRQEQQAEESYPWLSWSLTTAPNEFVVVGPRLDRGDTLGEQLFLSGDDRPTAQRLLVLRAAHVPTPAGPADRVPPLALRAVLLTARGRGE